MLARAARALHRTMVRVARKKNRAPGNRQGVGHVRCRAAKQTGRRDCAARRMARSQANGVSARRLREMNNQDRTARLRRAPNGA